ncbi:prolyl oligopeptidase family serine peptidase [Duganella sp. CY15W]|uniref:S9 family peptidase n=1 Tax=Duganella sp. CY15W TaxID=2692172 RepID=UPI00137035CB|nr:prolyl oligopeptidase family serine peptidase [Duganella sp. CY15W]MYM30403.1 prolyl oligopeptidase family serine peptidase [Duganella sp. CY15W]
MQGKYLLCGLVSATLAAGMTSTALAAPAAATPATAATASVYNQPPKEILDVMRAPPPPSPSLSPTRDKLMLVTMQDYPSIAKVATPFLRLAGVRIEPGNHSQHDTPGGYGIPPCVSAIDLVQVADGKQTAIKLPADACPRRPVWSADGQRFVFENVTTDAVELWVGDAKTGAIRRLPGVRLNQMFGDQMQWMPDQKTLLVKLVPVQKAPPVAPPGSDGPGIQESLGETGQSSTYENRDTLRNRHDEELFNYYGTSQLALVDVASGKITPVGKPRLYEELSVAPDGRHAVVTEIRPPYSYVTTFDRFPKQIDLWDLNAKGGKPVVREIAALPLADRVPNRGVPVGPRNFTWRPTEAATLVWAEALDGGDPKVQAKERDKLMMLKAPFNTAPVEITRTEQRYAGLSWSEQPGVALLSDYDVNRKWRRTWQINIDDASNSRKLVWDMSVDEKYANPGSPVQRRLANGFPVIRVDGDTIFLSGVGSSPEGDRPFLDKFNLQTKQTERLFRSSKTAYEQFIGFAGNNTGRLLTWYQSSEETPNAFLRTLGAAANAEAGEPNYASSSVALTHLVDPMPQVREIKKRLVKYKRADGLELSFTLYTPPGYKEGTRLPTILNAYPLDYADASKAGQTTGSQATFTRLRQYRLLLLSGYAIIDSAAFPIVGDPRKAYDTYTEQLVANAQAAVDEAVRLGVTDPNRVGVTGHSHGALMTANLLAHSTLFRAGAATSGSYNKSLTPFGFQNERRSVWEAPEVYTKASTFFYADKLKTPLLIVHGGDDANPGTTPLQSTKLYEAIRGNGGVTRLVMLPHEPHWYAARESNEQLVYEMLRWFDKYVKNAPAAAATDASAK